MSLRLKYLLPLNLIIVLLLGAHAYWDYRTLEREFMRGQVNMLKHLAVGLRSNVEHMVREGETIDNEIVFVHEMVQDWATLDIMILDSKLVVVAAANAERLGTRWHEPGIEAMVQGRAEQALNVHDHEHDGTPVIDVTTAVRDTSGRLVYLIHIARRQDELMTVLRSHWMHHGLVALVLLMGVAITVNALTYRYIIRPLERIHRRMRDTGWVKELSVPSSYDELARLHLVLNEMLERIARNTNDLEETLRDREDLLGEVSHLRDQLTAEVERVRSELTATQSSLIRTERFSALGQLSAALAHELRNPLHIVRGTAETAMRRIPEAKEFVDDITEEVDRIERLISGLLDYTRPVDLQCRPLRCQEVLEAVRGRIYRAERRAGCSEHSCGIEVEAEQDAEVLADPVLLEQALLNLLSNACQASPKDGAVVLRACSEHDGATVFQVIDQGPGVPVSERERVFEPFFTRRTAGTGLGLPVVQKVAELHGGTIELVPGARGGTVAQLRIHVPAEREAT